MILWTRKNSLLSNWSCEEGVLDVMVNRVFMLRREAQARVELKNSVNGKLYEVDENHYVLQIIHTFKPKYSLTEGFL